MTLPLEAFALIGDCETAALVSREGSIAWLCLPRFDSPACCAALLGSRDNGHWSITPDAALLRSEQRYRANTLIAETDLHTAEGAIRVTDFMPIRATHPVLIRRVSGLAGDVPTTMTAALRFDYGSMPPWVTGSGGTAVMYVGPDKVVLRSRSRLEIGGGSVSAAFVVRKGSQHDFVMSYGAAHEADPPAVDADDALAATERWWREWIGRFDIPVAYPGALRRSLLTLMALIHRPTGGLVAAATTSLPEKSGASLNWDYRYCWLRDSTFTIDALLDCGYEDEAIAWRDWTLRAVAGAPEKMQIMYRVDGSRRVDPAELPWLAGYRFSKPVRIGNAAAAQMQLDIYGEVIDMLHACERAGLERTAQGVHIERAIAAHVERSWVEPDQGLWESRGQSRHYVYSKVMTWVALHRFLLGKGADELADDTRPRLEALRDHIHEVVCREGFDTGLGSFTGYFGGQEVDASLLLLPKVGFLPASDERMAGTIARIEQDLVSGGLVHRHPVSKAHPQGTFLACSFWLAECQLGQGRRADAVATIERVLGVQSEPGLLSEEYDLASRRLNGNFPQALSHLALIHAVLALAKFDAAGRAA